MLLYLREVSSLSDAFIRLVAEALGLQADGLARFFDEPRGMMHRSKVRVRYRFDSRLPTIPTGADREIPAARRGLVRSGCRSALRCRLPHIRAYPTALGAE
jgi:hypothetical protein